MAHGFGLEGQQQYIVPLRMDRPQELTNVAVADALVKYREDCGRSRSGGAAEEWFTNGKTSADRSYDWQAGRRYMTRAGFRVRSKAEKIIADFLQIEGFKFLYEPLLQIGDGWISPDFYFTELQLPYEHFGMNTPEYRLRAESKIVRYFGAGIPFVYTTFNDETDLEDVLTEKLVDFY